MFLQLQELEPKYLREVINVGTELTWASSIFPPAAPCVCWRALRKGIAACREQLMCLCWLPARCVRGSAPWAPTANVPCGPARGEVAPNWSHQEMLGGPAVPCPCWCCWSPARPQDLSQSLPGIAPRTCEHEPHQRVPDEGAVDDVPKPPEVSQDEVVEGGTGLQQVVEARPELGWGRQTRAHGSALDAAALTLLTQPPCGARAPPGGGLTRGAVSPEVPRPRAVALVAFQADPHAHPLVLAGVIATRVHCGERDREVTGHPRRHRCPEHSWERKKGRKVLPEHPAWGPVPREPRSWQTPANTTSALLIMAIVWAGVCFGTRLLCPSPMCWWKGLPAGLLPPSSSPGPAASSAATSLPVRPSCSLQIRG